jgi:hypothetical protein
VRMGAFQGLRQVCTMVNMIGAEAPYTERRRPQASLDLLAFAVFYSLRDATTDYQPGALAIQLKASSDRGHENRFQYGGSG